MLIDCPHCPGTMIVEDYFVSEEEYCVRCQECGYYEFVDENGETKDD